MFSEENVLVRSNMLGERELEPIRQRVMNMWRDGRTSMEVMYRLGQKHTVQQTYSEGNTILIVD